MRKISVLQQLKKHLSSRADAFIDKIDSALQQKQEMPMFMFPLALIAASALCAVILLGSGFLLLCRAVANAL